MKLFVDMVVPCEYTQDQGRNFESDIFQELCQLLEIRKTRTSPRNPKGNGQIERFNRSLLSMIKSFLRGEQTGWDLNLGCLAGASLYQFCFFLQFFYCISEQFRVWYFFAFILFLSRSVFSSVHSNIINHSYFPIRKITQIMKGTILLFFFRLYFGISLTSF